MDQVTLFSFTNRKGQTKRVYVENECVYCEINGKSDLVGDAVTAATVISAFAREAQREAA